MINNDKGFIFLVTMLIIMVISMLVLSSMQHILLYYKAINKQEALHQSFYQLEDVALQLAQQRWLAVDSACVVHEDAANQVTHDLLHHKGCSLMRGKAHYNYLVEDLGEFPCLVAQHRATAHRRVSVVQIEDGIPISLLQIRFISPGAIIQCLAKKRPISLGVSSWRYFPSV